MVLFQNRKKPNTNDLILSPSLLTEETFPNRRVKKSIFLYIIKSVPSLNDKLTIVVFDKISNLLGSHQMSSQVSYYPLS
jgi:hypothetical protein